MKLCFRTWRKRFKAQARAWALAVWANALLLVARLMPASGYYVTISVIPIGVPQSRLGRFLEGPAMKATSVILALAIIAILGGLSFFNATQQAGIRNSVSTVISILAVIFIILFLGVIKRGR